MLCIGVSVSWFHHTLTMNHILLFFDRKLIRNFCLGSFIDPVFLYTKYCCGTLICHFDISSCDFIHKVIFSMQNMGILFVASSRSKKDQAPTTHILSVTLLSQLQEIVCNSKDMSDANEHVLQIFEAIFLKQNKCLCVCYSEVIKFLTIIIESRFWNF